MEVLGKPSQVGTPAKRSRVCSEIARGAEGVVTKVTFLGRPAVRKERFSKPYRHPTLDARLTSRRLVAEARALHRARRVGIAVPAIYAAYPEHGVLILEFIDGETVKNVLMTLDGNEKAIAVVAAVGKQIRRMHDAEIIHGDLTTSNMIAENTEGISIALIDFGLSSSSASEEDKAVDLYVFERSVQSAHPTSADELIPAFFEAYEIGDVGVTRDVMTRLDQVRSRGRKRDMTG